MDDVQAIRRLKSGDIGGLESLIIRYQVKAVRTAFLITRDVHMAEDVAQDVFIRVYQFIRYYDERRPFEPYLMRSVINVALNAIQKNAKWQQAGSDVDIAALEELLVGAALVEAQVEFAQRKREILDALSKLSPRQRAVIVQRYYLDMSEKEMADAIDAPPGTVKWLLNAARSRLRALLGPERSAK